VCIQLLLHGACTHTPATNLAELDVRISGGELAERSLEQVVVERHQHDVEALLRELLGYGLADAFF